SQGNITKKVCVITDKLNADVVYNEAVFGKNMTSIKRTTVSTPVTKLIPYGATVARLQWSMMVSPISWLLKAD
ncbi:hypothetical protein V3Q77_14155, partial [Flavobacterium davisii]